MKSTILILYCVFIYFDCIFCQDINAEDLKLLEAYEIQTLRDFVRGKGRGFVSKVSVDRSAETSETGEDILFEERQAQAAFSTPPSLLQMPSNSNQGMIAVGQNPNMEMSKFEIVPLSELLKPGESLVIPTFITPSPTTTERSKKRKQNRRPTTTTTIEPTTEGPSNEDFEELAKILQKFRKSQTTLPPPPSSTTPTTSTSPPSQRPSFQKASISRPHLLRHQGLSSVVEQTIPDFQEFVVSPLREKWKGMASPLLPSTENNKNNNQKNLFGGINVRPSKQLSSPPPSTLPPTLIPMSDRTDLLFPQKPSSGELVAITQEEWEEKMREISRKLGSYLMSVKKKKEQEGTLSKGSYQVNGVQQQQHQELFQSNIPLLNFGHGKTTTTSASRSMMKHRTSPKAYVTLLREGFFHQIGNNQYSFVASITLIRDSGKVILVDTGLATDINGRTDLIQKLSKLNIAPPMVDYVITTHGHPDHAGNTNDFPDSIHFQGNFIHFRTKFNISDLATSNSTNLTPNVKLIKTPGHTAEDISVIVSNTDKYGTIAIAGDIFISDKDIDFPMMWKKFSHNLSQQEWSRRELICLANFIVPGHGKVFKITSEIKNGVNCENGNARNHGSSRVARRFNSFN
uniref:Metallo-beta-lactamase domain-containing protein n=1 Tax=Panagrolaimus sp. ES5 TaxID=591445 RepID=A0AC34FPF8_9BILA